MPTTSKIQGESMNLADTYAFTGTVTGAGGGDLRNFIIDGDFTQWPEGNTTGVVHSAYTSALMMAKKGAMDNLVWDALQTSDAPTPAESGHASTYCYHADITTAESALAADEYSQARYHVTASDFSHLHKQEMTLTFWHKHTITGTCVVAFGNNAGNRYYPATYTQSVSDTWEKATITLTADTSGTWLHAGTGIGMTISFVLASGSTSHGTANTWTGSFKSGVSGMANHVSSASNNFKISQVGLYLGSTAPTFTSSLLATVQSQVEYYVERIVGESGSQLFGYGLVWTTARGDAEVKLQPKRIVPTLTSSAAATFYGDDGVNNALGSSIVLDQMGKRTMRVRLTQGGTTWTDGNGFYFRRDNIDTTWIMADARH